MRYHLLCVVLAIMIPTSLSTSHNIDYPEETRSKRQLYTLPLVYPYGATYRLILGLAAPIKLEDKMSLVFGASFLYQYIQFQNITELSRWYPINQVSREQRDLELETRRDERLTFYKALEEMLNVKGFSGHDCVLRAICEAAQYPMNEEGLFGEILHILLTPNYGRSSFEEQDETWLSNMAEYINANIAGRQMFSCSYIYSTCPEGEGLLELISMLNEDM